jgi:pimeloyl-ACP methyl ester carboxylesterase
MHKVCGCFDLPAGLEPEGLPAAMEAFLGTGPSPVYMTVGSMLPVEESEEDLTRGLIQTHEKELAKTWPVASIEQTVETSFGSTFMRVSGPTDAPPLVLLPGGGSTSLIWKANIAGLSSTYRVYALDNIYDLGQSIPTREIGNGADFAAWLDELFDALNLGSSVRIAGYSYGGFVASQYALAHPERTTRLVLLAPAGTVLPISGPTLRRMVLSIIPARPLVSHVMYWVWDDLAHSGDVGEAIVEERIDFLLLAYDTFKLKAVNPELLTDEQLTSLSVPTLFLVGEHEKI